MLAGHRASAALSSKSTSKKSRKSWTFLSCSPQWYIFKRGVNERAFRQLLKRTTVNTTHQKRRWHTHVQPHVSRGRFLAAFLFSMPPCRLASLFSFSICSLYWVPYGKFFTSTNIVARGEIHTFAMKRESFTHHAIFSRSSSDIGYHSCMELTRNLETALFLDTICQEMHQRLFARCFATSYAKMVFLRFSSFDGG